MHDEEWLMCQTFALKMLFFIIMPIQVLIVAAQRQSVHHRSKILLLISVLPILYGVNSMDINNLSLMYIKTREA